MRTVTQPPQAGAAGGRVQRRGDPPERPCWPSLPGTWGTTPVTLAAPPTSLPQQHELATHFVAVAESAGLPTILYNYPARAGVEIGLECLDRVAGHPLIIGLKESSGDFSRLLVVRHRYAGELAIMCGSDDQAADYFFWGVRGRLAGTATFSPSSTWRSWRRPIGRSRSSSPSVRTPSPLAGSTWKPAPTTRRRSSGLRHLGLDCGEVRPPLLPLGPEDAAASVEALDACVALMPALHECYSHRGPRGGGAGHVLSQLALRRARPNPGREAAPSQLRRRLRPADRTHEPRGRPQASANLVFPPSDPRADAAFIVLGRRTGRTP